MPSTLGSALRVTVFGQSHSPAVGCVVEGLPAGVPIDVEALAAFVARRAPGSDPWSTPRREPDAPRIVSGLNPRGETCGAPLAAVIENTNTRSKDYDELRNTNSRSREYDSLLTVPRPGHADFTAWAKWHGSQDVPGGGHFSGRLTAALCVAGGVVLQWLAGRGVAVRAHVSELGGIEDAPLSALDNSPAANRELAAQMAALADGRRVPTIDADAGARMVEAVLEARSRKDTLGGIVECVATGLPAGIGDPMFDGIENVLARDLFGIPSVKGVEFGRGFESARLRGSQNNDPYEVRDGTCVPRTNNAGGILGGITTGAPILVRCAFKPISSIMMDQDSVDLATMEPATLRVHGRHDTTAVIRAVPVVEAVCALGLADVLLAWPAQ